MLRGSKVCWDLRKSANNFLHQHDAISTNGFSLVILCVFYRQKGVGSFAKSICHFYFEVPHLWRWKLFLGLLLFWVCSPPFQICFLHLPGGSRTYLFLCPLCDSLWALLFWFGLESSLSSSFPLLLGALFNGVCQGFIIIFII